MDHPPKKGMEVRLSSRETYPLINLEPSNTILLMNSRSTSFNIMWNSVKSSCRTKGLIQGHNDTKYHHNNHQLSEHKCISILYWAYHPSIYRWMNFFMTSLDGNWSPGIVPAGWTWISSFQVNYYHSARLIVNYVQWSISVSVVLCGVNMEVSWNRGTPSFHAF